MVFRSEKELKDYLMSRCKAALVEMQEKIHELIHKYIKEFYDEFEPAVYERWYQLYNSLIMSEIKQTANGFEAVVYFDPDMMSHAGHPQSNWSEDEILETAMLGVDKSGKYPHGGYARAGGTGIWTKTEGYLNNNDMIEHFKQYLIKNGIPVK